MLEQTDEWALSPGFMLVEKLSTMCDDEVAAMMFAAL